jgi:protein-S-isoprenylcysteine O-methyltransferase Ste14
VAAGLPVALAGLALRAWACGHLAKNERLATTGPFAYTRNPLYLGTLVVAAGFALAGGSWWLAALFSVYFVAVYLPVIGEEESHLRHLFPEYTAYAARVPRLVPRLRAAEWGGRFQWALYRRNREYQALLAWLAGAALLGIKLAVG